MSDTDPAPAIDPQSEPPLATIPNALDEAIGSLEAAVDEALQAQTIAVRAILEEQAMTVATTVRGAVNELRTQVVGIYQQISERQDAQAKAIRFIAHDVQELRGKAGLPVTDLPLEDL